MARSWALTQIWAPIIHVEMVISTALPRQGVGPFVSIDVGLHLLFSSPQRWITHVPSKKVNTIVIPRHINVSS